MGQVSGAPHLETRTHSSRVHSLRPRNEFVVFRKAEIEQSVPSRFEQQVRRYPDRLAVKTTRHELTYEALNQSANGVARAILARRGQGGEPIALLLEHDAPLIAAILGVLKSGKFYVPMDPSYPDARNSSILEDSQAGLVLTDDGNLAMAEALADRKTAVVNVGEIGSAFPADNPGIAIDPAAIAYLIYTSGSTGRPKGVLQLHRNLLHNMMKYTNTAHLCAEDRFSLLASCSVSASRPDIFGALLNGGSVFPFRVKEEGLASLGDWLVRQEITIYHSVPTLFRHLLESMAEETTFPRVRLVKLGGEPVYRKDVELYRKYFSSSCLLYAGLGGSEMGNIRVFLLDQQTEFTGDTVPAGFAMEDTEVLLLDENGQEVGPGCIGEIAVRSVYLPPGYWRRPDLTETAFLPDPAGGNKRIYRTGDLGRLRPDGCLEHLGRKDFQVKVRGYRVELAEIEMALLDLPTVKETAVLAQEDAKGEKELVAFVVPRREAAPTIPELRRFLQKRLPDYMVPSDYLFLEALPLTPNGKVDCRALLSLDRLSRAEEAPFAAPRTPVEDRLAGIWAQVFGLERVGIHDNFFELGGHSLLAVRLFSEIEKAFGKKLPSATLFQAPTIEELTDLLRNEGWTPSWSSLVAVQPHGSKPPLFCVHPVGGHVLYYRDLARRLGPDQPFYALQAQGLDGRGVHYSRVEDMAAAYIKEIQSVQPEGPYFLGGLCFGGLMAFEIAHQLRARDEKVGLLALFDTYAPGCRPFSPRRSFQHMVYRFFRRIDLELGNILLMEPRQKLPYILLKMGRVQRRVQGRFKRRIKRIASKVYQAIRHPLPRDLRKVQKINRQGSRSYVPQVYPGRVTLFRAGKQPIGFTDPQLGWGGLAAGGLEIHEIPGYHESIAVEPRVQVLAEQLKACLETAVSSEDSPESVPRFRA